MKKNRKGFTLAELLIVVAIIGVLVAISIPIFHAQLRKTRLAVNQANGRAAFSAAEAAYLDNMEKYGSSVANSSTHGRAENYDTVTFTYFPAAGKGILNFHYSSGDNRWICDSGGKIYTDTDVSHWTVDTQVSDSKKLGDQVARIWTIHMNPENGEIKGYYCAFPKADEAQYNNVLKAFANGTESQYVQK
jgi:prepilin-type N-terminal cleavage/methylation domain-containing protein